MSNQKTKPANIVAYETTVRNMMSGAGGKHAVRALYNYLQRCREHFGDNTDPEYALNDIIGAAQIALGEYRKNFRAIASNE